MFAAAMLAGCVGDTRSATNVRAASAQLNARGHTNNGPASWWWEYGLSRSAVGAGNGTKTPKTGPASSATDVDLNRTISGLTPGQQYYFRACGQDQAAGSSAACGRVLSFRTALADSHIDRGADFTEDGETFHDLVYTAAPGLRHELDLQTTPANILSELATSDAVPADTSDIISSTSACSPRPGGLSVISSVICAPNSNDFDLTALTLDMTSLDDYVGVDSGELSIVPIVNLGDGDDTFVSAEEYAEVHGGDGNDEIVGGSEGGDLNGDAGNDLIYGSGDDTITGGTGDDTISPGPPGPNGSTIDCGPGHDTVIGPVAANDTLTGCEVITSGPTARTARAARLARGGRAAAEARQASIAREVRRARTAHGAHEAREVLAALKAINARGAQTAR